MIFETQQVAQKAALYAVVVCWWLFALTFWLRKRPTPTRETTRDWTSLIGLALQAVAYGIVWFSPLLKRGLFPTIAATTTVQSGMALVAVIVAAGSVWMVNAAARRMGKQWALTARLVEGHELIQDGPFRLVRNPIYTGMLGLLIATGMALAQWIPLLIAVAIFVVGTCIRVRSEERLLRQAFGPEFEAYARSVPALIPGIY